jgi:hypothetical protein
MTIVRSKCQNNIIPIKGILENYTQTQGNIAMSCCRYTTYTKSNSTTCCGGKIFSNGLGPHRKSSKTVKRINKIAG